MIRNTFIVFSACLVLLSCRSEKKENIIKQNDFVDVLVDMHFADAILTVKGYSTTEDSALIHQYYESVFAKYNITREQFYATLDYYSDKRTEELEKIYDEVLDRIAVMEKKRLTGGSQSNKKSAPTKEKL